MRQSTSRAIQIDPNTKLGKMMNPTPKEILFLNIYSVHNYLILPNTILNEVPEEYKAEVENYFLDKMSALLNRCIEVTNETLKTSMKKSCIQARVPSEKVAWVEAFLLSEEEIQEEFKGWLKSKLRGSSSITVKTLWLETFSKMSTIMKQYYMKKIDQFNPKAYGFAERQDDLALKAFLKMGLATLWDGMQKEVNSVISSFHTIAWKVISNIFKDEEIARNLSISSFTKHVKEDAQLDFTGEVTLDMSANEFQFLMEKARTHPQEGPSYAAKIYIAFKKQGSTDTLENFFSKMDKINRKNENTFKNLCKSKGEDEGNRLHQAYIESGKSQTESFQDYLQSLEAMPIDAILKKLGIDQPEKKQKESSPKKKTDKKKNQQAPKRSLAIGDTANALLLGKATDHPKNKQFNTIFPDPFAYHPRLQKWEWSFERLDNYFQNLPNTSPYFKYKQLNSSEERLEREIVRHNLRPIGQIIKQQDGANYFFALGHRNAQSALVILYDGHGNRRKGVVDIAISTEKNEQGQEVIYHQLFREAKLETILQKPLIDQFEEQQAPSGYEDEGAPNRSLERDEDGYIVHISKDPDAHKAKFLRVLRWKK